jgi:hypothetical protein
LKNNNYLPKIGIIFTLLIHYAKKGAKLRWLRCGNLCFIAALKICMIKHIFLDGFPGFALPGNTVKGGSNQPT